MCMCASFSNYNVNVFYNTVIILHTLESCGDMRFVKPVILLNLYCCRSIPVHDCHIMMFMYVVYLMIVYMLIIFKHSY